MHQRPLATHLMWCFQVIVDLYCAAACKEVMRRHGAKAITVQLGALGAPSAKAVPGLAKRTLNSFRMWLYGCLGIFIWHGALVSPATDVNGTCPQAGPIACVALGLKKSSIFPRTGSNSRGLSPSSGSRSQRPIGIPTGSRNVLLSLNLLL